MPVGSSPSSVKVYLGPKTPITWTSPDHDLTKKAPRANVEDKEEFEVRLTQSRVRTTRGGSRPCRSGPLPRR
jgi:hypothetical protein